MAKRETSTDMQDNIVQLFGGGEEPDLPELSIGGDEKAQSRPAARRGKVLDLTGTPRLIMTFGAGSVGKSVLIRWQVDRAKQRGDGKTLGLATLDADRPTLRQFYPEAMKPGSSAAAMRFFEQVLNHVLATRTTTIVDFSADQTLAPLLTQMPDLLTTMEEAGIEPVTLFVLAPREADLSVVHAMERAGFQAPATGLVLNLGRTVATDDDAWMEFNKVRRHSIYKAVLDRGATEVWMPRLWAARAIEDRGIGFSRAVTGEGIEPRLHLPILDRARVKGWLDLMEQAFVPMESWLL